ncbi:hypothetical protein Tco_1070875 [Tanacetum coccineum]|uniref:Uncharacterized protein n=1 Tax=Tanacetum coccineum TaxID=301880 RepID=A0ABQ5HMS7_9ASTR
MSGKGRKLPGGGSTSRKRGPQAFPDAISREELDRILRQKDQAGRVAGEDNDVREDNQQSGGDYSEDEEGDNEEVQDESEESD